MKITKQQKKKEKEENKPAPTPTPVTYGKVVINYFDAPLNTIMDNLYEGIDTEGLRKTSVVRHSELEIETLDNVEYTDILISVPYNSEDGNSIILLRSDNPKDTINQISYKVDDNAVIKNEGNLIMVVNYYDQTTQNKIIENFDKLLIKLVFFWKSI